MRADFKSSVFLITSKDPNNKKFGTGFAIHQDKQGSYFLTCMHVINDVGPDQVIVGGHTAEVIAFGSDDTFDMAVLRVKNIDIISFLRLNSSGRPGSVFAAVGFQLLSNSSYLIRPIEGRLGKQIEIVSGKQSERMIAWDLKITDDYKLQRGYSGSPVIDVKTEDVIAIVSHRLDEGKKGIAISIEILSSIWPEMPDDLLIQPQKVEKEYTDPEESEEEIRRILFKNRVFKSELLLTEQKLSEWLEAVGFKRNPFEGIDARYEPYLMEYFIYPVGFEKMLGNNPAVLYAPRGGGKTASRRMVEHACEVGDDVEDNIFTVVYEDFQGVVEQASGTLSKVTAKMHVEAIIKNSIQQLFDYLLKYPKVMTHNSESMLILKQFIQKFPGCIEEYRINKALRETNITKTDILNAIKHDCIDGLLFKVEDDFHPLIRFMTAILKQEITENHIDELTPTQLMERLFNLIKNVGFDCMFILIDNVDGLYETDDDDNACVTLLSSLAGTVSLMCLERVYFKFFLPIGTKPIISKFKSFRINQVRPVMAEWPPEKLHMVLRERLKAATKKERRFPITTLDEVSVVELRGRIDNELVKHSKTPRDLLTLGKEVLQKHQGISPDSEEITEQDIQESVKKFTDASE
ncbi:MAG: trypsin-like peptidase domain-containing protein [Desulfobacterales bacterium]|nr:trypsin-like peptidase domain-containing protein [Desulfobacterales bacterium]